jgi:ketosteroid isomerase-like protein
MPSTDPSPRSSSAEPARASEPAEGSPSEAEVNRRIVRAAFEAWQAGTVAIAEVFAPDMVWRIEGRSVASKEYSDRQQFIDEVLAPFGARFTDGERFRPVRIRSIHADQDTVIAVWDGSGTANDGGRYDNTYAWVMKMRDGLVIDGTAFFDSIEFNELWERVPVSG